MEARQGARSCLPRESTQSKLVVVGVVVFFFSMSQDEERGSRCDGDHENICNMTPLTVTAQIN